MLSNHTKTTWQRVVDLRRRGWTVPGIVAQTGADAVWVQTVCDFVDTRRDGVRSRAATFATVDKARAGRS